MTEGKIIVDGLHTLPTTKEKIDRWKKPDGPLVVWIDEESVYSRPGFDAWTKELTPLLSSVPCSLDHDGTPCPFCRLSDRMQKRIQSMSFFLRLSRPKRWRNRIPNVAIAPTTEWATTFPRLFAGGSHV